MRRAGGTGVLLVVALCLTVLLPATGGATRAKNRLRPLPSMTVRLSDVSQQRILRLGRVKVRVRARRATRVRVYGVVRPTAKGGAPVVITRTGTVTLRARHSRSVFLRIATAGRRALVGCAKRTVEARVVVLQGRRRVPGRTYRNRRSLRFSTRACRAIGLNGRPVPGGAAKQTKPIVYSTQNADRCDITDPAVCLQPFPNDLFTTADAKTDTKRRVNLNILSMPTNKAGKPIDPGDINRNDGFSPGSPITTKVPGLDSQKAFERTGAVPITDMARAFDETQPVVVINTRTLERHLIWAEVDANPTNPAEVNLIVRPGINFDENTRYVVALRNLRDAAGKTLEPNSAFRIYRDGTLTANKDVEARRAHFESIFSTLAQAGIDRDSLYRAWDFTVASERSLSERQLAIRNDAYKELGDTNLTNLQAEGHAPPFTVTKVTEEDAGSKIARTVEGTYTVPCYLNAPGCPTGSRFAYPSATDNTPQRLPGNTMQSKFTCKIPRVALQSGGARPGLYGHGLFGSRGEVGQGQLQDLSQNHNFVFCATDWVGMACTDLPDPPTDQPGAERVFADVLAGRAPNAPDCDVPTAIADENDLSNFPTLVDRVEQSFVNFMYLGRLMIRADGFSSPDATKTKNAFKTAGGADVINRSRLFYDGNSQGGIFGGSLIALEPDLDRGVVGVPGMNYSTLLQRSSDFGTGEAPKPDPTDPESVIPEFAYPLYQAYPNQGERQLILSLIQQMWDHSDPDGIAQHMTSDPLPNTPPHQVLMQVGLGDHQVSNFAAEVEARTIGAHARTPWADPGRFPERQQAYALPPITAYPFSGSAIVLFDIGPLRTTPCAPEDKKKPQDKECGTPPPPTTNVPPSQGRDPHEYPRRSALGQQQKSDFLRIGGQVTNPCGTRPCYAGSWKGP